MQIETLNSLWQLRPVEVFRQGFYPNEQGWLTMELPGHWQQHPSLCTHTGKVVYRRRFAAEPRPERRFWLRLNGVFYWSRPFLNGHDLGLHESYFAPQEHDVTPFLARDNLLVVEVECPDERNKVQKRMITGVFSHWDCLDPETNPGGIWLPVELIESGPLRLSALRCHTEQLAPGLATLRVQATINAAAPTEALLQWTFTPRTFEGEPHVWTMPCQMRAGQQQVESTLRLRDPRLWWSHDLGTPDLYDVSVRLLCAGQLSDEYSFIFGIRRFELRNWIAYLNGRRLFIKGSNYGPGDTRIAQMTYADYLRDVRLATECNLNLLRVHAHVEHPAFYRAANEAGMLVWQDFALQWLYRSDVLAPAVQQARAMVDLLYNHPSVVVWCMHNEPFFVADTKDNGFVARVSTAVSALGPNWNRDRLDNQLRRIVAQDDPSRPVVRSSGEPYVPSVRQGSDSHFYFGWYPAYGPLRRFDELRRRFPQAIRFVTEFGAQSFPNLESCARFMPLDIDCLDVAGLAQRHHFQPEMMAHWYNWRACSSLEELVVQSQRYQSELNRFYIDRLRYHKYRPTGGIVSFLFHDSNPAVQWSVLDYWRIPKRSYHALRLAFSPCYIFTLLDHDTYRVGESIAVPVYVVNDRCQPLDNWIVRICLYHPNGSLLADLTRTVSLEPDSLAVEVERLRLRPDQAGSYTLDLAFGEPPDGMCQKYTLQVVVPA